MSRISKQDCLCGLDTSPTGLRTDIFCPKHDAASEVKGSTIDGINHFAVSYTPVEIATIERKARIDELENITWGNVSIYPGHMRTQPIQDRLKALKEQL